MTFRSNRVRTRVPMIAAALLVLLFLAALPIWLHPDGLDGVIALASADEPTPVRAFDSTPVADLLTATSAAAPGEKPGASATAADVRPSAAEEILLPEQQRLELQLEDLRRFERAIQTHREQLLSQLKSSSLVPEASERAAAAGTVPGFVPNRTARVVAQAPASNRPLAFVTSQLPSPEHLMTSKTFTLVRNVYAVPASKASSLAEFLQENVTAEVQVEIQGPTVAAQEKQANSGAQPRWAYNELAVQVTAPAEVQAVVSDLIGLMQGSEKRSTQKPAKATTGDAGDDGFRQRDNPFGATPARPKQTQKNRGDDAFDDEPPTTKR